MDTKAMERLGDEMSVVICREVERTERLDAAQRRHWTHDYNLLDIRRCFLRRLIPTRGVRLLLRGYELIIENPSPVHVRFSCGNLWIGEHLLVARCLEQAVDMICSLLSGALPAAIDAMKNLAEPFERAFMKCLRLKSINYTAEYLNRQYGNQHQHEGASGYPGDHSGDA